MRRRSNSNEQQAAAGSEQQEQGSEQHHQHHAAAAAPTAVAAGPKGAEGRSGRPYICARPAANSSICRPGHLAEGRGYSYFSILRVLAAHYLKTNF